MLDLTPISAESAVELQKRFHARATPPSAIANIRAAEEDGFVGTSLAWRKATPLVVASA